MGETRKIAAILVSDVVGYSRLAAADEDRTLARLRALRSDLIDPTIALHNGRIVKRNGDGGLVEFRSVVDAVRCAIELQNGMVERNAGLPSERRIEFRIGIHVGDVVEESDGDLMGDGVNIAARLEGIAKPGAICLSEDAYRQVKSRLDLAVSDLGPTKLKNIVEPVRVYLLEVSVPASVKHPPQAEPVTPEPSARLALPEKPSIAVLPFQNMSGDPEQEYFADGMVEEIITGLSRIKWLFVIARNSSFVYKGRHVDVKQVGRELGVRYVLEGSVRKSGNRVRITCQLIDAGTGAHLWADRFDGPLEDVFDLQDKVAASVAGVIEPALQEAETARSTGRPTTDRTAYDLYLRAHAMVWSSARQIPEALALLERAIARDPHYGPALAWAAMCCYRLRVDGSGTDPDGDSRKGFDFAQRALKVASNDPDVIVNAALALSYFGEDIDATIALVDRALALNPNFARGWHVGGILRLFAGHPELAIEHAETALRLSPRARVGTSLSLIGQAHFLARRFYEAVPKL